MLMYKHQLRVVSVLLLASGPETVNWSDAEERFNLRALNTGTQQLKRTSVKICARQRATCASTDMCEEATRVVAPSSVNADNVMCTTRSFSLFEPYGDKTKS